MVLGARVDIVGPAGRRGIAVEELFREDGAGHLSLERGELVAAVELPPASGWKTAYVKARASATRSISRSRGSPSPCAVRETGSPA